jgi:hypothetical protein
MIQDFLDALVAHRQAVVTATRGKTFLREVEHFIARLHALPQHPASQLSTEQFESIGRLSEEMIAVIETRIARGGDDASVRQELAESVYAIRRKLEEIYRWRHYSAP